MFASAVALPFKVFRTFGVFQPTFNSVKNVFEVTKLQVFYVFFITIIFQGMFSNFLINFVFKRYSIEHLSDSLTTVYAVIDFCEKIGWMMMNLFFSLPILKARNIRCYILNSLNDLENNTGHQLHWSQANGRLKQKARRVIQFLALFFLIIYPITVYVCNVLILHRFESLSLFNLLSSSCAVVQFTFGNFYCMLICEKLRLNYQVLIDYVGNFAEDLNGCNLRQCMEIYYKLWKWSQLFASSMRVTQICCLIGANILMSFNFYYNFLNLDLVGPTIVWQMLTALIFVSCHYWGKVCGEVSNREYELLERIYNSRFLWNFRLKKLWSVLED